MKRRKRKEPDYAFIAIKVDDYSARADVGINTSLLGSPRFFESESDSSNLTPRVADNHDYGPLLDYLRSLSEVSLLSAISGHSIFSYSIKARKVYRHQNN